MPLRFQIGDQLPPLVDKIVDDVQNADERNAAHRP
jgi:hypothetical protein